MTIDSLTGVFLLFELLGILVGMCVWGFLARYIVKSKGYPDELNKGFWWGFFLGWIGLIVCVVKPQYQSQFDRFSQFGGFNNFGGYNQNGYGSQNPYQNNYGQGYNGQNMYGGQYQQQYPQQPQQPQQQSFTQPDNYYTQPAQQQPEQHYDSGAEMDGIDTSNIDLDDLYK